MNPNELKILQQIEIGFSQDDTAFADQIAGGPRLSLRYVNKTEDLAIILGSSPLPTPVTIIEASTLRPSR